MAIRLRVFFAAAPGAAIRGIAVPRFGAGLRPTTASISSVFGLSVRPPGLLSPLLFCPLALAQILKVFFLASLRRSHFFVCRAFVEVFFNEILGGALDLWMHFV